MRKLGGQKGRNPIAGEKSLHSAQAGWIEAPFGRQLHRSRRVLVTFIMARSLSMIDEERLSGGDALIFGSIYRQSRLDHGMRNAFM